MKRCNDFRDNQIEWLSLIKNRGEKILDGGCFARGNES